MEQQLPSPSISIMESLSLSWAAVRSNVWVFMGFTFLYCVVYFVANLIPFAGIFLGLFSFILSVSMFSAFRKLEEGAGELSFNDFFSWSPKFGKLFLTSLVIFLITLGISLVIMIGFFLTLGFGFFSELISTNRLPDISSATVMTLVGLAFLSVILAFVYFMFTFSVLYLTQFRELSISECLSLSWKIGKKNAGQLLVFLVLAIGISLLGVLALGIGLFVATPVILGMHYYFLSSMFPEATRQPEWDFMKTGQ